MGVHRRRPDPQPQTLAASVDHPAKREAGRCLRTIHTHTRTHTRVCAHTHVCLLALRFESRLENQETTLRRTCTVTAAEAAAKNRSFEPALY